MRYLGEAHQLKLYQIFYISALEEEVLVLDLFSL